MMHRMMMFQEGIELLIIGVLRQSFHSDGTEYQRSRKKHMRKMGMVVVPWDPAPGISIIARNWQPERKRIAMMSLHLMMENMKGTEAKENLRKVGEGMPILTKRIQGAGSIDTRVNPQMDKTTGGTFGVVATE